MTININWSQSGNTFQVIPTSDGLFENLPADIYSVSYSPMAGWGLTKQASNFELPTKILLTGNDDKHLDQLFTRKFEQSEKNLGVLLAGEKGTGKSLLMKRTCNNLLSNDIPVILVEKDFEVDELASFISSIKDTVCVVIDEFEKRFDKADQEGLLSLLDGTSSNKKMFILTANDVDNINEFMINRPSRIKFYIKYDPLNEEFINTYLDEYLKDKSIKDKVSTQLGSIQSINFDLLKVVVDEVNDLYPTLEVDKIFSILNVVKDDDVYMSYDLSVFDDNNNLLKTFKYVRVDWGDVDKTGKDNLELFDYDDDDEENQYIFAILKASNDLHLIKGRNEFTVNLEVSVKNKVSKVTNMLVLPTIFRRSKVSTFR